MNDRNGFQFNRQISLGDFVVAITAISAGVMMWVNLNMRVTRLETIEEWRDKQHVEYLNPDKLTAQAQAAGNRIKNQN